MSTTLAPGTRLGPYEIVVPIGAGGMGEVYRARDTRLARDVAIKVLPAEFASDPERLTRFEREARATAALDHPNILAIFDIGAHEGVPYIVEQLLDGESLRERIKRGPLAVRNAGAVAGQIAQGLAAAHEKRIIHRDLKPENVFITLDGVVKILDFGLAKLVEAVPLGGAETLSAAPTGATVAGHVLGTAGYMAPEQARGLPVDQRADVFAFGVVLYELLSGVRPFRGDTYTDTVAAVLKEEPPPLPAGVPVALQGLVSRCLEKRPEARYQSGRDLARELQDVLTGSGQAAQVPITAPARARRAVGLVLAGGAVLAVAAGLFVNLKPYAPRTGQAKPTRIVVLPFENLGAPEDAYFAAGMAEEITSRLANVQGLGVISRTSAIQYDQTGKTVKQIGADLGVDFVLEGSVRWEHGQGKESRVRITPQLIRVADDTHVWADRYDRVLADVFAIQSEVAESAVRAMGVALLPREQTALKEVSTNDLQAYDLYLRGLEEERGRGREGEDAAQMYQSAVDRDPQFAQALAGLARVHAVACLFGDGSPERLARCKAAAERAVELRPDLAESHSALGYYFFVGPGDYPRALAELAKALEIQPGNSEALLATDMILRRQGRWVESAEVLSKALESDPKNQRLFVSFAMSCTLARRYADADGAYGLAIAMNPQTGPYGLRARLQLLWHGDLDKAQAILEEAEHTVGVKREELSGFWVAIALCRRDYPETLRQIEAQEQHVRDDLEEHSSLLLDRGQVQMLMGQRDLARRSFEAARVELEQLVRRTPNGARLHVSLGITYAGLGRRAEAIREAKLGRDLIPSSEKAVGALFCLEGLALVYTMVGQPGEAIALLDDVMSRSGDMTPHRLRLNPAWDPLRSDPRFAALLKKHEIKP
jgi:TolB-like protein/tetratricopeptide (TPR) repeat protein